MKELEQYIRSHASEFDVMEPLPGHEERFLARLEQAQKPARRPWRIVWGAVAVAASLSALLFVTALRRSDPEAIYLAYMDEVSQLYAECPADAGADWDEALASLTEEANPLFLQLPEEMSRLQKARVLRAHYGSLLEGAKLLAKQ
jgi:hypothetical protein